MRFPENASTGKTYFIKNGEYFEKTWNHWKIWHCMHVCSYYLIWSLKYWRKLSKYNAFFMALVNKWRYIKNKKCLQCFSLAKLTPSEFLVFSLFARIWHCKLKKAVITYYPAKNIWSKLEKPSKIGQGQKALITAPA